MTGGCHIVRLLCVPLKEIVELPGCVKAIEATINLSASVIEKTGVAEYSVKDPERN